MDEPPGAVCGREFFLWLQGFTKSSYALYIVETIGNYAKKSESKNLV